MQKCSRGKEANTTCFPGGRGGGDRMEDGHSSEDWPERKEGRRG